MTSTYASALISSLMLAWVAPNGLVGTASMEKGVDACEKKGANSHECARAIEELALQRPGSAARRNDEILEIRTTKGYTAFHDAISESNNSVAYSYLGYLEQIKSHVVHVQYYEGNSFLILDYNVASKAYAAGFPIVSPDNQRFLSIYQDAYGEFGGTHIEMWSVNASGSTREATFQPSWMPVSAVWLDANKFEIAKLCLSEEDDLEYLPCGKAHGEHSDRNRSLSQ